MRKPVEIKPLPGYKLWLRYSDGVSGVVNLSDLVGQGVFSVWNDPAYFERVRIAEDGSIRWDENLDLCPDALYLKLICQNR